MQATAFHLLVVRNQVGADLVTVFGLIVLGLVALGAVGVLLAGLFGPARRQAREFEQPEDDAIATLRRRRMIVRGPRNGRRHGPANEAGRGAAAPPDRTTAHL
jgi:hypothetical protein